MKRTLLLLPALALGAVTASGQILYLQPFDNETNQLRVEEAGIGWQRATHTGVDFGQAGRLSDSKGVDGVPGLAYSFGGSNNSTLMWNGGVNFTQSQVTGLSAMVFHGNASNELRFLIRIDDDGTDRWYASAIGGKASTIGAAGAFETEAELFQLSFATTAWVPVLNADETGPFAGGALTATTESDTFTRLGVGDLTANAVVLPDGNITAVGAYLAVVGSATRFDDFTVIPEPSTYAALLGLLALGLVAWRRRK